MLKAEHIESKSLRTRRPFSFSWLRFALPCAALGLSACVAAPPRARVVAAPPSPPVTDVYVYPSQGQSDAQLDRDRYECNAWAVKQTHYDPSEVHNEAQRVQVVSGSPPGANTAAGVITGAVLGAILGGPRHAGGGAVVGAVAGGAVGAASDNAEQQQADRVQERYDARTAAAGERAQAYRRAIGACLEGRGYTVK